MRERWTVFWWSVKLYHEVEREIGPNEQIEPDDYLASREFETEPEAKDFIKSIERDVREEAPWITKEVEGPPGMWYAVE